MLIYRLMAKLGINIMPHYGGLEVIEYQDPDIRPLLGLLNQEFPNWSSSKIKSYMNLVTSKANAISGVLVAKNQAEYYVGILIYTFQQIDSSKIDNSCSNGNKKNASNIFVVENLIASSLILQSRVFLSLVESGIEIAKNHMCDYIELPKFDTESYDLLKEKYKNQITDYKDFRTYLKLNKSLEKHL